MIILPRKQGTHKIADAFFGCVGGVEEISWVFGTPSSQQLHKLGVKHAHMQARTHTHTFNHPERMCFSSSFEAEIFELHESSYEALPSRSTELLRPSDNNNDKIPRIH